MKRVQIGGGNIVSNVSALAGGSPDGVGTFLDLVDMVAVGPGATWNGSRSAPTFTPPPMAPYANPFGVQTAKVSTIGGVARVNWVIPFADEPVPIGCQVFDPTGRGYDMTLIENTALSMAYQISIRRPLPAVLGSLLTLLNYDTYTAAPDGLPVYLSAKIATQ